MPVYIPNFIDKFSEKKTANRQDLKLSRRLNAMKYYRAINCVRMELEPNVSETVSPLSG